MHIYINENMEEKRESDHYAIFMEGKKYICGIGKLNQTIEKLRGGKNE